MAYKIKIPKDVYSSTGNRKYDLASAYRLGFINGEIRQLKKDLKEEEPKKSSLEKIRERQRKGY